jgi:hypothetical protein
MIYHRKSRGPRLARHPRHIRRYKKAVRTLGRALSGGIISPSRPWFSLTIKDDEVMAKPGVREWLETVQRLMQDEIKPLIFLIDPSVPLEPS